MAFVSAKKDFTCLKLHWQISACSYGGVVSAHTCALISSSLPCAGKCNAYVSSHVSCSPDSSGWAPSSLPLLLWERSTLCRFWFPRPQLFKLYEGNKYGCLERAGCPNVLFFFFPFQLLRNVWRKLSSTRLLCYLPYKWLLGLQEAAASRSEQQGCVPGATSNDFQIDRSICDMGTPGHGCTGMHCWRLYLALKGALLATTLGSCCLTSS